MANWGAAFETLGRGLGALAGQRLDLESRKIEAMRQEAIRKIERQEDVARDEDRQAHSMELFEKGETSAAEREKRDIARDADRQKEGFVHTEKMQGQAIGAAATAADKRSLADAVEQANQNYTQHVVAIQKSREDLQKEKAKLLGDATLQMADAEMIKTITGPMDEMMKDLDRREAVAKQTHILTTRRLHAGGYGKTDVVSAEDVRKLVGAKGPNNEPVRPSEPDVTSPTAAPTQAPAPRPKPAPASMAPEPVGKELFPAQAQVAPPNGLLELLAANQKKVDETEISKPSLRESVTAIGSHLSANHKRLQAEAEARRQRDRELMLAIR